MHFAEIASSTNLRALRAEFDRLDEIYRKGDDEWAASIGARRRLVLERVRHLAAMEASRPAWLNVVYGLEADGVLKVLGEIEG